MSVLRILNAEPENYSAEAASVLATLGEVVNGPMQRAELMAALPQVDVLIVRLGHQVDRQVLDSAGCLKVIGSATTGLDHIDLEAAHSRGIAVLSLRGETEFLRTVPATAEHTWALLLALVRHIPAASQSVRSGHWDRDRFRGHDLAGRTIGILGLGRIGERVAAYANAFDMKVSAYDPERKIWPANVERMQTQSELLARSQILSIHVPLNPSTQSLIGASELERLPRGAFLINTSRGQVIDEAALLRALESGHLAGAALDVLSEERSHSLMASPLIRYAQDHANLLITPHIGGATYESMAMTEIFMAKRLKEFLEKSGTNTK